MAGNSDFEVGQQVRGWVEGHVINDVFGHAVQLPNSTVCIYLDELNDVELVKLRLPVEPGSKATFHRRGAAYTVIGVLIGMQWRNIDTGRLINHDSDEIEVISVDRIGA